MAGRKCVLLMRLKIEADVNVTDTRGRSGLLTRNELGEVRGSYNFVSPPESELTNPLRRNLLGHKGRAMRTSGRMHPITASEIHDLRSFLALALPP
jgi:hypothetical protein